MAYSTTDQHESGHSANRAEESKTRPLVGLKAISAYAGRSENTVLKLVRDEGFPASKIGGGWESDEGLIDAWRMQRVR